MDILLEVYAILVISSLYFLSWKFFVGSGVIAYKDKDYHLFTGYMVANFSSVIIPHVAP